jgi:glycosyltransferase involved in cell wall biosynthesis
MLIELVVYKGEAVFHLNEFDSLTMVALILRPFKGKVIFHSHSAHIIEYFPFLKRIIFRLFLKRVDECILVGAHLKQTYAKFDYILPENTVVQNAFLPPTEEDEPKILMTYDPETLHFIDSHKPLVIANAAKINLYKEIDLYGLDMSIQLITKLKIKYPDVGLLFALAEIGNSKYYNKIIQEVNKLDIQDNIHFMSGQKELWPLFKKANLMIRPTFVDGYGISIAEALYLGCPAIASDVCERPEGTLLFRNRDNDDLLEKVKKVLHDASGQ